MFSVAPSVRADSVLGDLVERVARGEKGVRVRTPRHEVEAGDFHLHSHTLGDRPYHDPNPTVRELDATLSDVVKRARADDSRGSRRKRVGCGCRWVGPGQRGTRGVPQEKKSKRHDVILIQNHDRSFSTRTRVASSTCHLGIAQL